MPERLEKDPREDHTLQPRGGARTQSLSLAERRKKERKNMSAGSMLLLLTRGLRSASAVTLQPVVPGTVAAGARALHAAGILPGLCRRRQSSAPLEGSGFSTAGGQRRHSSSAGGREIKVRHLTGEHAGIAELLMHRASAKNALGKVFVNELFEAVESLRHDPSVRVLIVKSEIKGVFCSAALPMPTIAALDGHALGGGLELALACDLRTAASSAKIGLIETTRGLLPGAGGSQRLPRLIGLGLAKELIFTGRQVTGDQALSLGLVNHAVAQKESGDAAYHKAMALAEEIVPQAPVAVKMAKLSMNKGFEVDIASGMSIEGMCYAQVIPTKDRIEGMAAFSEKRLPHFTGE
ncbi:enoyl-CoA hydratase domain-containing protein 2, mitochondrial isoform X2 [Lissotriton helveticus]